MLASVIGMIGRRRLVITGRAASPQCRADPFRTSIPGSKSVPSRNWSRWDLVEKYAMGFNGAV